MAYLEPDLAEIAAQLERPGLPRVSTARNDDLRSRLAESVDEDASHHAGGAENRHHIAAEGRSSACAARELRYVGAFLVLFGQRDIASCQGSARSEVSQ